MEPLLEVMAENDRLKAELAACQADVVTYEAYCHSLENALISAYGDQAGDELRALRANAGIPLSGDLDPIESKEDDA